MQPDIVVFGKRVSCRERRRQFGTLKLWQVIAWGCAVWAMGCQCATADEQPPAQPPAQTVALTPAVRERCLTVLRDALKSDEFWPSMHAAEALSAAGHGREVIDALLPRIAKEADDQHRCGLARELVRAGDCAWIGVLLDVLAKKDPYGHVHAAESLYKIGEIGDGRLLRNAAANAKNPILQAMAAGALARCGSPAAMENLRQLATDGSPETARIASWILGAIGDRSDIPQLRKNRDRFSDPLTRSFCEHALAMLGDPAGGEAVLRNLESEKGDVRTYAAGAAGDARLVAAASPLKRLLDDETIDTRVRAAHALLLLAQAPSPPASEPIVRDVYAADKQNPRYTEGSILRLRDGTLLYAVTQFAGSASDFAAARIIARSSADGGRTWGAPRVLQENVGRKNVMSVTLRRLSQPAAGLGSIGLFYLVKNAYDDLQVWLRISDDEAQSFGEPIPVTSQPGYHVMNNDRVTLLSSGRLLAPIATTSDVAKANHFVSSCCISDDGGKTWRHGKGNVDVVQRGAMEPEVLELADGGVLMIVRTQLGYIAASYSDDGGDTWSKAASWNVAAPEAPATLRRIPATGDLLLIWNNTYQKGAGHGGKRTPLTVAISADEGRTWKHIRNLEDRTEQAYAYTSLVFIQDRAVMSYWVDPDGTRLISSRFRSVPVSWFYQE